ncbi:MAG: DUF433 domain-containing protein [Armatimonadetes bacterium]|nr:DUF433 domain-containing protein [Armatimonadota bacterium]MBS1728457.1 DUF433 domain-containing protein [Armatimonadota bacterium]
MEIPCSLQGVLTSSPEVLGGTICFAGTRVPVETFLDYIETGHSLERFLDGFPSVSETQAKKVLEWQSENSRLVLGLAS